MPLAYTLFAGIARLAEVPAHLDSSIGQTVSLDPTAFHLVSVGLHLANASLCFCLVRRLTGRARAAWICSLVFALHPLQLESVGWISELRGLTSGGFVLLALNAFVQSRQGGDRAWAQVAGGLNARGDLRNALQAEERCHFAPDCAGDRSRRPPHAMAQGFDGGNDLGGCRPAVRFHHPGDTGCFRHGPVSVVAATLHRWRCALAFYLFKIVALITPLRRLRANAGRGDVARLGLSGLGSSCRAAGARLPQPSAAPGHLARGPALRDLSCCRRSGWCRSRIRPIRRLPIAMPI